MKRFLTVLIISLVLLSGCSQKVGNIENGYTNFGNLKLPQFQPPEVGEEIGVITTNKGVIKIKLLDEVAPVAVEYFKKWVEEGKYTESIFANISKDRNIMIQGSEYKPDMTQDESDRYYFDILDNMSFDDDYALETSKEYLHFSGAVGFAHFNSRTLGYSNRPVGIFYIVANGGLDDVTLELLDNMPTDYGFTRDVITAYRELGGILDYNGNYVVFGQVFYGMDLVYEINNMLVDDTGNIIKEPVVIEKIEIIEYEESRI